MDVLAGGILVRLCRRKAAHIRETAWGMVLVATRSPGREELQFPPAEYVHDIEAPQNVLIGPVGRLYAYTVIHSATGDEPPRMVAMVDFEPGVRAFGPLLQGEGPPEIDGDVRVVPYALPDGARDYAFRVGHDAPK